MTQVLVTGGTGSLGHALVPHLLNQNYDVIVLSRDPHKQAAMKLLYPAAQYVLGDICDRELMLDLCSQAEILVHAAALKIVGDAQRNTKEYNRVNVLGALNVAEACRLTGVNTALFISSDKACQPVTAYGKTKALGEELWLAQNTLYRHTKFSCVRYGNVVISNGSVWHVWQKAKAENRPIIVKYPEATRFMLTMSQAVGLVMNALRYTQGGEIFVPAHVPAFSIWDLAREIEPDENNWSKQPLLPSEKQHEIMVAETEYAEPIANDTVNIDGITLWYIDPRATQTLQETPPMFHSAEACKLTGKQVIERLTNVY